ncbi:MAG: hypothetical protein RIE73_29360 [Coleofasciculus sp. C1-SOL-03]
MSTHLIVRSHVNTLLISSTNDAVLTGLTLATPDILVKVRYAALSPRWR